MEIQNIKDLQNIVKSGKLSGGIIIYGDEKWLIKESVSTVYNIVSSFPEMNIINLEGENISFDDILNACETIPFMSDNKVVHVKNPFFLTNTGDSVSKAIIEKLSDYVKNIPGNIILLMTTEKEVDKKSALYKAVKNIGIVIEYKTYKGDALQKWVSEFFRKRGKEISKSDIIYLISEIGASTEKLTMEIDKICSYAIDEDIINRNHIDAVVHKSLESNIFKMVDGISKKNAESSISILDILLFQKEDYTRIIGMIIRQFRLLYSIKLQLEEKKTVDEIRKSLKLNEYVLQNLIKLSKNYSHQELRNCFDICLDTDFKIKSGKLNPELALELLVVELCK